MRIYNKTSETFLRRIRSYAREIMASEMGITYKKTRFLFGSHYYPLNFVVFEHKSKLGFYQSDSYQVGLNKMLMYGAKTKIIKDILRHELAHMMTSLKFGNEVSPHGQQFKEVCRSYGWPHEVSGATAELEKLNQKIIGDLASEKIMSKVSKLLKLAESSNLHESQLATSKVNQILIKHNLESIDYAKEVSDDEIETCVLSVLEAKRVNGKLKSIYEILSAFYVQPVFNYGKNIVRLEVVGSRTNVQIAEYVANFLNSELEKIWLQTKKENHSLKGLAQKNSFLIGVSKGFKEKLKASAEDIGVTKGQLIKIDNDLIQHVNRAFPRLGHSSSSSQFHPHANELGKAKGKSLNINPAIGKKSSAPLLLN